jgi:hypothetical protein
MDHPQHPLLIHATLPQTAITKIFMVTSSHFDAGCKTPGCGNYTANEPHRCANTTHGLGEPYAFHIINRYFDQYIPRAIQLAEQARQANTSYNYLIQPWIAALYLNCSQSGVLAWPNAGFPIQPAFAPLSYRLSS